MLEAVHLTFPLFDQLARLLQETHIYTPPCVVQSTAANAKSTLLKSKPMATRTRSPSVQSSIYEDPMPISSHHSHSPTAINSQVDEKE